MEEQQKVDLRSRTKMKYRLRDRFLSATGELDWPLYLTIIRISRPKQKTVQELTRDLLLKVYAPSGVLVNQLGTINYIHGHTGLFLEPAQGYAGINNVFKMVRKNLRRDLNKTLYQAITSGSAVDSPLVPLKRNGETTVIAIRVIPLPKKENPGQHEDYYLVIFEQQSDHQAVAELSGHHEQNNELLMANRELIDITEEIESKQTELSTLNSELDDVRLELEISRNKLHLVKANIDTSETELQSLMKKINESNDELVIINHERQNIKNELETNMSISETMILELPPSREEPDTIEQDLFMANHELNLKNDVLEKMDRGYELPAEGESYLDLEVLLEPEKELESDYQLKDVGLQFLDEGFVNVAETRNYQAEPEPFEVTPPPPPVNEKGMGFFSKNEPKPFPPNTWGRSFTNEPDAGLAVKMDLVFKDALEFQAAASHGYRHDSEIKSVHIPEGVEVIRRSMFYKCTQLEVVTLPSTLKSIEDFAFYGCEALKKIDLNQCKFLEVIGTSAFEGCKSMTGLVIPDSLIEIEEAAFLGCQAIETIEFQENSQLEILGSHVFKDCEQIKRIILPDQLKHIGISCFYGCQNLAEIHLPNELETVGEFAFFGCNTLEKIGVTNKKILKQPGFSVGFPEGIKL